MAINFSAVKRSSMLGRAARLGLKLVPRNAVVPVLQGELRGMKWIAGSSLHGCWLGTADSANQRILREFIRPGSVFYDLGANVGYYTLLASRLVAGSGRVFAFEPLPRNLEILRRHVGLNHRSGGRCTANVTIIDAAVSDAAGTATFMPDVSPDRAHLVGTGDRNVDRSREAEKVREGIEVRLVSIDDLTSAATDPLPAPNMMKIDVEGAEAMVFKGAARTIDASRPVILLATHGPDVHAECCEFLRKRGYTLRPLGSAELDKAEELLAVPD